MLSQSAAVFDIADCVSTVPGGSDVICTNAPFTLSLGLEYRQQAGFLVLHLNLLALLQRLLWPSIMG